MMIDDLMHPAKRYAVYFTEAELRALHDKITLPDVKFIIDALEDAASGDAVTRIQAKVAYLDHLQM